ncbi:MAG: DUF1566 domain-containing protein [Lentisphaeria bacterium]|nr:DUF1566 domain-containing protein [Lentisphaeria bacterium]
MRFAHIAFLATLLSTVFLTACSSDIDVSCEPDCTDRACGPDPVCGHSCGICGDNATCEDGLCECEHQVCNGLCCAADEFCRNNRCLLPTDPCFDDTTCATQHRECISVQDEAICGDCLSGHYDFNGQCDVDCTGRVCGPTPNGDLDCGTCPGATDYCTSEGLCEDDCAGRNCGPSPHAGFDCGSCSAEGEICMLGQCGVPEWQNPAPLGTIPWQAAYDNCNTLTFDGHNDWRLPTINELRALIVGCPNMETGGACEVTDSCLYMDYCDGDDCGACPWEQGPSDGCYWPAEMQGECAYYWSVSEIADRDGFVWTMHYAHAGLGSKDKDGISFVRCIRRATP